MQAFALQQLCGCAALLPGGIDGGRSLVLSGWDVEDLRHHADVASTLQASESMSRTGVWSLERPFPPNCLAGVEFCKARCLHATLNDVYWVGMPQGSLFDNLFPCLAHASFMLQ